MSKQYRTRDGREVRLLMTDAGGDCPVIGAYKRCDGVWVGCDWPASGCCPALSNLDLVEVKSKHVRWINLYNPIGFHHTRESADEAGQSRDSSLAGRRIACLRIEFEEGDGL
jgi:hypothetical protein